MIQSLANMLIFLLPFERLPSFDVMGITIRLSSLVILFFIVVGLPILLKKKKLFPLSSIDISIMVYYAVVIFSVLFAEDKTRSLVVAGLIGFVMAGYVLVSRAYRQNYDVEKVTSLIVLVGFLTSLFGLYQFFGDAFGLSQAYTGLSDNYTTGTFGFPRIQSVGLEPLYYADFLLFPIFILAIRMAISKTKPRWQDMLMLLVMSWVFVLALSRGAYIAILAAGFMLALVSFKYRELWRQAVWVGGIVVVALALSYGSIKSVSGQEGTQEFSSHAVNAPETRGGSANPRMERFQEAWRLFKEKPVTGVGIGNFGVVSRFGRPTHGYEIVNNQYLETLAETGVIGLIAFLSLGALIFAKLLAAVKNPKTRYMGLVLGATLVGVAAQYNFFSTVYMLHVWVLIALVDALPRTQNES